MSSKGKESKNKINSEVLIKIEKIEFEINDLKVKMGDYFKITSTISKLEKELSSIYKTLAIQKL